MGVCFTGLTAQTFPDRCAQAYPLVPNERVTTWTNDSATFTPAELPAKFPGTCVQSFENDGWFSFRTLPDFIYYEVRIVPHGCNTPAGLQALVIEAQGCDSSQYVYRACANPKSVEPIRMVWQEVRPDIPYLVYVDGYDGTICSFDISLSASRDFPDDAPGLRTGDMDYTQPEDELTLESQTVQFVNNEIEITWSDPAGGGVDHYLVERVNFNFGIGKETASVLARINPSSQVSGASVGTYTYHDISPIAYGEETCYRIVQVMADRSRIYYEKQCAPIQRIEGFSIGVPLPNPETPDVFLVQYTLIDRQPLGFALETEDRELLKSFTLARNAPKSGFITLNMHDYPTGTYWLKARGKDGEFRRSFYWNPQK